MQGQALTVMFVGGEAPPLMFCPIDGEGGGGGGGRGDFSAPVAAGCVEFLPSPAVVVGTERPAETAVLDAPLCPPPVPAALARDAFTVPAVSAVPPCMY